MTTPEPSDLSKDRHRSTIALDPSFQQSVARLYQLTVYGRWLTVGLLWLTVGLFSLWHLRYPISLLRDYFTWSTVRYGLASHLAAAIGLGLCIGMTLAVLMWQSRNILLGLPELEQERLEKAVVQIKHQGKSHPLWKWVCK